MARHGDGTSTIRSDPIRCRNYAAATPVTITEMIGHDGEIRSTLPRATLGRTSTSLPAAFTPCTAKTFFAKSIPTANPLAPRLRSNVRPHINGLPTIRH